ISVTKNTFHIEMPGLSKRQAELRSAIFERWSKDNVSSESEESEEEDTKMDADFKVDTDDEEDFFREIWFK
ncbi:unnamed protein product, partial [Rotaria sordida]